MKHESNPAAQLSCMRWAKIPKAERSRIARELARARWDKLSPAERKGQGGRPRLYPPCPRGKAHRFSPEGVCRCGFVKATQ